MVIMKRKGSPPPITWMAGLLLIIFSIIISPGYCRAAVNSYDFSTCTTGTDCWAYENDSDVFPYGGNQWNRNDHAEPTAAEYTYISASNNNRWQTDDPGNNDEMFLWIEMPVIEPTTSMTQIALTFEGYLRNRTTDFTIYVLRDGQPWEDTASWVQVGTTMSIPTGSDSVMTRNITTNFSDYVNSTTGLVTWGVAEARSSERMLIDYVKMDVTFTEPDATSFTNDSESALNNLGARVGQTVTLTGTNFGPSCVAANRVIKIGGYTVDCADVSNWTNTSITFTVNSAMGSEYGGSGANGLRVSVAGADDLTPLDFVIYPSISSLVPSAGCGSTTVTVNGDHFCGGGSCPGAGSRATAANNVTFYNGQMAPDATVTAWSDTQITLSAVPAGAATGNLTVTSNSRTSNGSTFTVPSTPPSQSGWNPAKGSSLYTDSVNVSLTLSSSGDCRWSLADQDYDSMGGDCSGDGTTSIACNATGLASGPNIVYIACQDTCGNKDSAATNEHVNYTVETIEPYQDAWWDPDGIGTGEDWAYRVPMLVQKPSGYTAADYHNKLVVLDADFAALGFDDIQNNSPRVVRYNGSSWVSIPIRIISWSDGDGDSQDDRATIWFAVDKDDLKSSQSAVYYYLYFDLVENGAKSAPATDSLTTLKILCMDNDNESQACEEFATYSTIDVLAVNVYEATGLGDLSYSNLILYDQLYFGWNAISNDQTYQMDGYETDLLTYASDGGRILCAASDDNGWENGWLPSPGTIYVGNTGDQTPTMFAPYNTEIFAYPNANALNGITEDEDYRNVNTGAGWIIMAQDTGTPARKGYLRMDWGSGLYILSSVDARNAGLAAAGRNYFKNSMYWAWRWNPQPLTASFGTVEWYTPDAMTFFESDYSTEMTSASVGDTLYIQMTGDDINDDNIESHDVTLFSDSDTTGITVTLTETAADSGIFRGTAQLAVASNDGADQIASDVDDVVTAESITKVNKTDTITVAADPPASITSLDLKSDATYTTSLNDTVDIGSTLYIEVLGTDSNASSTDITTVTIISDSDATGISVDLVETGRNTGVFRGTAVVSNTSDDGLDYIGAQNDDTITVTSAQDGTKYDTCLVKNQPPSAIYSVNIYESDYTTPLTSAAGGDTIYIEVIGEDGNIYSQDNTTVNVTSSVTDPVGIGVQVTETGANTGAYRGTAILKASSSAPDDFIGAQSIGETITVTSDDDPTKTDTLTVTNSEPTVINSLVLKSDATYSTDLNTDLPVGDTLYIEISAVDTNAETRDTTTVNVKSSATDPTGISVTLTQVTPTSSEFRGTSVIKSASSDPADEIGANVGETVTVSSDANPARFDTVDIISTDPTSITSLTFMSDATFSTALSGSVSVGQDLYIEVVAVDLNPESKDTTTVYVISSSDPTGITVTLTESGNNTGEFDGIATVSSVTNDSTDEIEATNGDTVTSKSTVNQSRQDTVSVVGVSPKGVFSLDIYESDYTTPVTQVTGGQVLYVEARGVDGSTGSTDKCTVSLTSTSDPTGITLTLDEQSSGTEFDRPYHGTATVREASSQSSGYIKAVVGDTITIQSDQFVYRLNGSSEFWFEGETANRLTPNMTANNGSSTSGGQYVFVPQGSYTGAAEYVVYKDTAGSTTYYLYGRMYPEDSGGRQFYKRTDNNGETTWDAGTGYDNWTDPWRAGGTYSLGQGAHVFRIRNTAESNDAVRLDKAVLKPSSGAPTGYGSDPVTDSPNDTVDVINSEPSVVSQVVLKSDGSYTTDLTGNVEVDFPLYIQLEGTDGDAYTVNTTTVTVKSSTTDPAGISVTLTETGINTGIYRNMATVRTTSNDAADEIGAATNETITITSDQDGSQFDTVVVDTQAVLSIDTVTAVPTIVNRSQENITVTFTVDNNGSAPADISAADLDFTNDGDFTVTADPGNPTQVAGSAQDVVFTFDVDVHSDAALVLNTIDGTITASDALSGANVSDTGAVVADSWTVNAPGELSSTIEAAPTPINTETQFTVTMTVTNNGGNAVDNVTPSALTPGGSTTATLVSGPNPANANIAGSGGEQQFTWTYQATTTPGTLNYLGNASGNDAVSGDPVSSASTSSNDVIVQTPATLTNTMSALPTAVTQGQNITVTMTIENTGGAAAENVTPSALTPGGTASASYVSGPNPANADIPGAGQQEFTWYYQAGSQNGTVNFSGDASGADANSGAGVSAPQDTSNDVSIQQGASLSASISINSTYSTGQSMIVTMTVTNNGESGATGVIPSALTIGGTSGATYVAGPNPTSQDIPAGEQRQFTWGYTAGATSGTLDFTGSASGTDSVSGTPISTGSETSNTATVQLKAALSSSISPDKTTVSTGQTFTVTMTVDNTGEARANNVAPSALTLGGTSSATLVSGPNPTSIYINGGTQQQFTWTYQAGGSVGTVNFTGNASGTDANSGLTASSGSSTSSDVTIEIAGALTSSIAPETATVNTGQYFTVTMTVDNTGGAYVNNVAPSVLTLGGTSSATLVSGPDPAGAAIPGSGQQLYTWTYQAGGSAGTVNFTGNASGTDANSGDPVSSTSNTSSDVTIQIGGSLESDISIPAARNTSQNFTVTMTVTNNGASQVNVVAPSALTPGGTSSAALVSGPNPANADIPGSGQQQFTWTYQAGGSEGTVNLTGNASGTDDISGLPVSSTATTSNDCTLQDPAVLSAVMGSSDYAINVDQTFTVTLTVNNTGGETAVNVTPSALTVVGGGGVTKISGPVPASANITGGGNQQFTWSYKGSSAGTVDMSGSASGTGNNSGAAVNSNSNNTGNIDIQDGASLSTSISAVPGQASNGQTITVTMTVDNTGDAQANGVTPSALNITGTSGDVTLQTGPDPANADIPGGGQQQFTWTYTAGTITGTVYYSGNASGTDDNTGDAVNSNSDTSNVVLIQTGASLSASIVSAPADVSSGQQMTVTMTVTNNGQAAANVVAPSALTPGGTSGDATYDDGPAPASWTIPGGASRDFVWHYTAGATTGTVNYTGNASGTDANSGNPVSSANATSNDTEIQGPAALSSSILAAPQNPNPTNTITVTMTVTNTGGAAANTVTPSSLTLGGTSTANYMSGPVPANATISGSGGEQDFVWTYAAGAGYGTVDFTGNAAGTDANSGNPVSSAASTSNEVNITALSTAWIYPPSGTIGPVRSSASVRGTTAYIGSDDDKLYAINADTGALRWSRNTGGDVVSTPYPLYDGGSGLYNVFVGSNSNYLYAVTENNQKISTWADVRVNIGNTIVSTTVTDGIRVYLGSFDQKVHARDTVDGSNIWTSIALNGSLVSSPAVSATEVYIGSSNGKLYALNSEDGTYLREFDTGGTIESSPWVDWDNTIYVTSYSGKLFSLNASNFSQNWVYPSSGSVGASVSSPWVELSKNAVYFGSNDGKMYAVDKTTGLDLSGYTAYQTGDKIRSSPLVWNDVVYFGSDDGKVYAISADTGTLIPGWPFDTGGMVYSSPGLYYIDGVNDRIIIGSNVGKIFAFEAN